jgi:hypothetical protein
VRRLQLIFLGVVATLAITHVSARLVWNFVVRPRQLDSCRAERGIGGWNGGYVAPGGCSRSNWHGLLYFAPDNLTTTLCLHAIGLMVALVLVYFVLSWLLDRRDERRAIDAIRRLYAANLPDGDPAEATSKRTANGPEPIRHSS